MEKYNFLPMWYRDDVEIKSKNKLRIYIIVLLALLSVSIIKYYINISYISALDKAIEENIYGRTENEKNNNLSYKDKNETIYTFNKFKDGILKNYSIEDVFINKKSILLEIEFLNIDNLTKFIKDLEGNQEYRIKKLELQNIEESNLRLKVSLERKKNDTK